MHDAGLRPIVSMGRPSTVRFGGRRGAGAGQSKRTRLPPSSVLSFKAINQVLQNVLQVRIPHEAIHFAIGTFAIIADRPPYCRMLVMREMSVGTVSCFCCGAGLVAAGTPHFCAACASRSQRGLWAFRTEHSWRPCRSWETGLLLFGSTHCQQLLLSSCMALDTTCLGAMHTKRISTACRPAACRMTSAADDGSSPDSDSSPVLGYRHMAWLAGLVRLQASLCAPYLQRLAGIRSVLVSRDSGSRTQQTQAF